MKVEAYYRPSSVDEAVRLKRQHGDSARYLAGGSDLLVVRPARATVMIDIRHMGLNDVRRADGEVRIGGAALLRDVESAVADVAGGMLTEATRETAPWLIRNSATPSGNLANASPAADSVPALLALDASLCLRGDREERVPVGEVLVGPHRTTLGDCLIVEIVIPAAACGRRAAFIKHARSKSDIAQVNAAVTFRADGPVARDVRIALGAVAPTAMRARQAETLLEGQELTPEILARVRECVADEVRPISDWRATESYRRRVAGIIVCRALQRAMGRGGTV